MEYISMLVEITQCVFKIDSGAINYLCCFNQTDSLASYPIVLIEIPKSISLALLLMIS